jgi:hypothetical protein
MASNQELLELVENIEKFRFNYIDLKPKDLLELAPNAEKAANDALIDGRPEKQIFGVSAKGGEELVAQWLKWLQFVIVDVTPDRRDGGFDVIADNYLVQVKTLSRDWVGVAPVREIYGVAQSEGKQPMFWVRGTLSEDAFAFANKVDMPVFQFSPEEGLINAANDSAKALLEEKLKIRSLKYVAAAKGAVAAAATALLTGTFNMLELASQHFDSYLRETILEELAKHRSEFPHPEDPKFKDIIQRVAKAPNSDDIAQIMMELQLICISCDEVFREIHEFLLAYKVGITSGLSNIYELALND